MLKLIGTVIARYENLNRISDCTLSNRSFFKFVHITKDVCLLHGVVIRKNAIYNRTEFHRVASMKARYFRS